MPFQQYTDGGEIHVDKIVGSVFGESPILSEMVSTVRLQDEIGGRTLERSLVQPAHATLHYWIA